jgi:hypothetical protein
MKSRTNRQRLQVSGNGQSAILVATNGGGSPERPCNQLHRPAPDQSTQIYYRAASTISAARSTLPLWSFETPVDPIAAKQDRIHIRYGHWTPDSASFEEIDALRELISSPPECTRSLPELYDPNTVGIIFARPQKSGSYRWPLKVRAEALEILDSKVPPVFFSGAGMLRPSGIYFDCWLNLNLYVRNQIISPMPDPAQPDAWADPNVFELKHPHCINGEFAHDGRRNWIPDDRRWAAFSSPQRYAIHRENCLRAVGQLFESELERANRVGPRIGLERDEHASLFVVETYWDFSCDNPVRAVADLEKPFLSLFARERGVRFPKVDKKIDHNMLYLVGELANGVELRIYAKTNRRIRVEVIHSFGRDRFELPGGHTTRKWDTVCEMIEKLAEDAARRVNEAFEHFAAQTRIIPSTISADQLLLKLGAAAGDLGETIKDFLVQCGAIAAGKNPPDLVNALRCLCEKGVLEYRRNAGGAGNYVPTEQYRSALKEQRQRFSRAVDSVQPVANAA